MKDIAIADVRNFAFVGHTGSGKTALVDALLFKLGVNNRLGSTDDGSSMADWTDEEKERKISIWAKPFDGVYKSKSGKSIRLVMFDTPGYADFFGQVVAATAVADAAVLLVDATAGIQVGTNRAWRRCEELGLPRAIVITGLDKDNADFAGTLAAVQRVWGNRCVPVVMPTKDGSAVVDVLASDKAAGDVVGDLEQVKNSLVESAAESDDALIEKYLGGEALSADEIAAGLRGAVRSGGLVPVFAMAVKKDLGVTELLDGIGRLLPSPQDRPAKDAEGKDVDPAAGAPFIGQVWRSVNDPFVGQLTYLRVCGGTLSADSEVLNASKKEKERIAVLYFVNGKKQDTVPEAQAGDVVALAKLKHTTMNHTLCAANAVRTMAPIRFPHPVIAYAVAPKTQGDEDKLGTGLQRLAEEDQTLSVERNAETHEMILSGMGDVHLAVAVERLKARSNVDVVLNTPKVPYKETVTSKGEGHYKHKKQTGGRGQYGEVYLRVEPRGPSDEEWFIDDIVGGAIPSNFLPAVQKGLNEGMAKGAVAGYPVVNVRVSVYDGSYHEVDSSEIAFKIAAARAFRDGMLKARPVLLEPIMKVKIMVPEQHMGDVTGDLNHKRGRILGMG
ncbi:MAG: elongation factor G, partial [Kiritimatiellae bacterium]|nr:elongation factor G [Kiritimatiellia bacterium]